jgi:hypothetical protein
MFPGTDANQTIFDSERTGLTVDLLISDLDSVIPFSMKTTILSQISGL